MGIGILSGGYVCSLEHTRTHTRTHAHACTHTHPHTHVRARTHATQLHANGTPGPIGVAGNRMTGGRDKTHHRDPLDDADNWAVLAEGLGDAILLWIDDLAHDFPESFLAHDFAAKMVLELRAPLYTDPFILQPQQPRP